MPLLIEPEPGLLIERFEQYLEFVDRIDSPLVGLNFDIGHAYCVGEDPQDWIARMAAHTRHYHLEDIAATRVHQHLIPGRGAIDFAATLAAIEKTGYDGWLTVELYPYLDDPDAAAREAREYLLRCARSDCAAKPQAEGSRCSGKWRAYFELLRFPGGVHGRRRRDDGLPRHARQSPATVGGSRFSLPHRRSFISPAWSSTTCMMQRWMRLSVRSARSRAAGFRFLPPSDSVGNCWPAASSWPGSWATLPAICGPVSSRRC